MATLSPRKSTVPAPPPQTTSPKSTNFSVNDLTMEELENLTMEELDKFPPTVAQEVINLQDDFARKRAQNDQKRSLNRMKLNNLREVEREALARAQAQAECARAGHIYPTGETRLRGQKVGQGQNRILQLTCNWCYQQYQGIGNEPDQLSPSMASRLDLESYGG